MIPGIGATLGGLAISASAGVLDGLSPTGAWSMSRDLLTAFAGGTRYTTVTGVDSLKDQSGNARHFIQGTLANQPVVATAGPNSVACADFDGVDDLLASASLTNFITNSSAFFIVSCIVDAITTDVSAAASVYTNNCIFGDSLFYTGLVLRQTGPNVIAFDFDTNYDALPSVIATGTPYVFTWRHEGGTLNLSVNGAAETSVAAGNTGSLGGVLRLAFGAAFGNVKIFEFAAFSTVPSSGARATMVANFKNHIGA